MKTKILKNPRVFAPILAFLILLGPTIYLYSGSPPETEVQVYTGAWLPHVLPGAFAELKERGMNTVFLKGGAGSPAAASIQTAHRNGLKVAFTLAILEFDTPSAEDMDIGALNSDIIETAEFAEGLGVEFFAPLENPDSVFGEDAGRWAQEILPRIKEVYHGEVIWKAGGLMAEGLSGYDYIGFRIQPREGRTVEEYTKYVDSQLDKALGFCAEIDSCKGIMVTEFGTRERIPGIHGEDDVAGHEIVLERGKDKAAGFFYFDEIPGVFGEWEEEICRYYKEMS